MAKLPRIIKPMENVDDLAILMVYNNNSQTKSYSYLRGKYGRITFSINEHTFNYRIEQKVWESLFGSGIDTIQTMLDEKRIEEYKSLTGEEKKIYDSVMRSFPSTKHISAMNVALQGGTNFQFIPK